MKTLITFGCDKTEHEEFKKYCDVNGYSQSKYIRLAINEKTEKRIFKV